MGSRSRWRRQSGLTRIAAGAYFVSSMHVELGWMQEPRPLGVEPLKELPKAGKQHTGLLVLLIFVRHDLAA